MKSFFRVLILLFLSTQIDAQQYDQLSSAEIYEELEKFNFLGSALYIAAHPDDENTRLIAFLSKGKHARTAYLSLTRGDGGQNLIGTEIRDLLGVIRSQELQMARQTDGGQQFFTRANDFGYSKHPKETLEIWDEEEVYSDVIQAIRMFKPDVIINRFDHRTPGRTHGHHTTSAMLSHSAFKDAADSSIYPEQLEYTDIWQTKRQFFNTSWWFYGSRENFANADKTNLMSVDVGAYYPTLGVSNNEISAIARSKHRSQGFGSAGDRGSYQEYLELINGDMPDEKSDIFEGINTSWTRVPSGEKIQAMIDPIIDNYNFLHPEKSVPALLRAYNTLEELPYHYWIPIKKKQLEHIILQCMGLFIEVSTDELESTLYQTTDITLEVSNRSSIPVSIKAYQLNAIKTDTFQVLESNESNKWFTSYTFDENDKFTNPYWLNEEGTMGLFKVADPLLRNKPESDPVVKAKVYLTINGVDMTIERPLIYKKVDPASGEVRQPFILLPPGTIQFNKDMYLFANADKQKVEVTIRASRDSLKGRFQLDVGDGWSIDPNQIDIEIPRKGMEEKYVFLLDSPDTISESEITGHLHIDDEIYSKSMIRIDYPHIPLQNVLVDASSKLVKVPLEKGGNRIAYIMGAGDKVPESLRNVGYQVFDLETAAINSTNLHQFSAIVIGIRAYNAIDNLKLYNDKLYKYVEEGGTLVVQYNTSRRLNYEDVAPYPLQLSRNRVTDENAEIRILAKDHSIMNYPNKITADDFEGWVQERGLYFPDEWSSEYTPILSSNDEGEEPLDGSLLIARHGDGHFVYTGLSWFRQLPAGVPGAYRIFANLLALSSNKAQP